MDFPGVLQTFLTSTLSGVLVAFITAKYALWRFYREKWWEKNFPPL